MITDAWTRPGNPIVHLPGDQVRRLAERYHPDLDSADVRDLTLSLLKREIEWRVQRRHGWDLLIARNEWFQREASKQLAQIRVPASRPITVFAHSYAAAGMFRLAKERGWMTVLGQIDPGEEHFKIVRRLAEAEPGYGPPPEAPPVDYMESWHDECSLADWIVVNSEWSKVAMTRAGVRADKVRVMPLAYESSDHVAPAPRHYPDRFTKERPLRLLFVGSVSVVKGVPELLRAMKLIADLPVTLRLVGGMSMTVPPALNRLGSVEFVGAVPRGEIGEFYSSSDVLVFPSHSDGFGMAQIEAQAAGLPIIASTNCGRVVDDGVTGILLKRVEALEIATAVERLVRHPRLLDGFSEHSARAERSTLLPLGEALIKLRRE